MSGARLTPTQQRHVDKAKWLMSFREMSPEAKAELGLDDTLIGLAVLDHCLQGYKSLGTMKKGGDTFTLIKDTDTPMLSKDELREFQLMEVQRALELEGQDVPMHTTWTPEEEQFLMDCVCKHITQGAINEAGRAGTEGRVHADTYPDPELAGTPINVHWVEGQQDARGKELIRQQLHMINQMSGAGLLGVDNDAMHIKPAGLNPGLTAAVNNIFRGARSLNQAEGLREGKELTSARESRRNRLLKEQFEAEHGKHDYRTLDANTKADNKLWEEYERALKM